MQQRAWDLRKPYDVLRYVLEVCKWPPYVKLVYLSLYRHRNAKTGKAKVEYRTIAEELQVTPKVAIAAVKSLEIAGGIQVQRGQRTERHRDANEYMVVPPWEASATAERIPSWKRKQSEEPGTIKVSQGNEGAESYVPVGNKASVPQGNIDGPAANDAPDQVPVTMQAVLPIEGAMFPRDYGTSKSLKDNGYFPSDSSSAEVAKKRSPASSSKEKPKDPYGAPAQALVRKYDAWLKEQGKPGLAKEGWAAAVRRVKDDLAGRGGKAPMPYEEADAAIEEAFRNEYWRRDLIANGVGAFRRIWAGSKEGGKSPVPKNRFVDHHSGGAEFSATAGFRSAKEGA